MASKLSYEQLKQRHADLLQELSWQDKMVYDLKESHDLYQNIFEQGDAALMLTDLPEYKREEKRLKESEKRYREILENMEEGFYEVDLTGKVTFFNPAFLRIYGYSPEEIQGANYRQFESQETATKAFAYFNHLYRTGELLTPVIEQEVIRKDGKMIFVEVSVSLIKDVTGKITGFRGIVRDVTEKKRVQQELQERETLYRTLFDHAGFAVMVTDARTGERVAHNKLTYEQLGYTAEEYNKIPAREFWVSGDEEFSQIISNILQRGSYTYTVRLRRKDGEIRDFFRSSVKVKIGGKTYIHGIRVDITDQKRAEQALRESEARFRSIFEGAADPIFLMDGHTARIMDINDVACTVLGYSREELLAMSMEDIETSKTLPPATAFTAELQHSAPLFSENTFRKKDGSQVIAEVSSCLLDQDGQKIVLSIARDITRRKETEKELDRYRLHLEDIIRERTEELKTAQTSLISKEKLSVLGQLTATVSHELRNPLAVIQMSNFYLQRKVKTDDERIRKHLNRIEEQVEICNALIADLLEYTRGKKAELNKGDLHSWLPRLVEQMSDAEGISIQLSIPGNMPWVYHDQVKLRLVMVNLLSNAIQAVREKMEKAQTGKEPYEPAVSVTLRQETHQTVFEVDDNGTGMDPETQVRAFEPLFTTRARGTGLGLANVQKIIAEHGGKVFIASEPDKGTRASFILFNKDPMAS